MKVISFLILHTIALGNIPLILIVADKPARESPLGIDALTGFLVMTLFYLFLLELFFLGFSTIIQNRSGQLLRAFWGLLFLPIAIYSIIDFQLYKELGSHLNIATIKYSIINFFGIWPILSSGITLPALALTATTIIISVTLATLGWKSIPHSNRLVSIASILPVIIITIAIGISDKCIQIYEQMPEQQPQYVISFFNLFSNQVLQNNCPEGKIKGSHNSALSNLKLSQLINSSKINSIFQDRPEINTTPIRLDTTNKSHLNNIVIITLESFRTDAVTPYNPKLQTTPFLNQLAHEGLKAETAYVDFFHTSKSLLAINCGMPPHPHSTVIENKRGAIPYPCLPELLKPLGYNSAFFQTATKHFENREGLVNNMQFNSFSSLESLDPTGWEKVNYFGLEDKAMVKPIMTWVDQQQNPFLLSLVTVTSHHPYNFPTSFPVRQFDGKGNWNKYLNTLHYTDSFLAELFQEFDQRRLLENTLFILTGDHGVGIGRHDTNYPFQGNIQIPLIIWNKNLINKPAVIAGPRQHSDIVPTIIDLLNFEITQGHFYGNSLLKNFEDRTIYISCKLNNCQVLLNNEYKYISPQKNRPATFSNLTHDTKDQNNLVQQLPNTATEIFDKQLQRWRENIIQLYK